MDKSVIPAQTALNTIWCDYADEIYIAANLAGKGCMSDIVVDQPFLTIGDYTYLSDGSGQIYMFPYGPTYGAVLGQAITNRTYWNYGVVLDFQFIADNRDKLEIGGKDGHYGFPYYRIEKLVSDILDIREIFDEFDINAVTG